MMNLYNYLAVMITERMTGLDHTCLKIWDFYTYVYTLSTVEKAMNITIILLQFYVKTTKMRVICFANWSMNFERTG